MREQLDQVIERLGGRRRVSIMGIGVAAVLLILGMSWWATRPSWIPAFSELPLESVGKLTDKLTEAGIPHRLAGGGTKLLVRSTDIARARVVLAREGLPTSRRPGLELFDQPSWGMTDFTQRINYRRALEGELERTIANIRGVESAEVHIALHEASTFRQPDRRPEASVVLRLRNGMEPSPEVVRGIAQLVASSVDGLKSDDVMILDDSGRLLSIPNESGSVSAAASRQLAAQREVENYLRAKAEQIVTQIVGPGNARVDLSAVLNFDKVDRTTQSVDPNRQALTAEQRAEIIPGAQGGAGSTNRSASYENSRSLESFAGAIGTVRRLSVAVLVNERQTGTGDKARSVPRTEDELDRIRNLIAAAVGIDSTRGDVISVASMSFSPSPVTRDASSTVWTIVRESERPILLVLALLLAFFVALRAIRSLRPAAEPLPAPELALAPAEEMPQLGDGEPEAGSALAPVDVFERRSDPVREGITAAVTARPELAARLVRAWLKES